MSLDLYGPLTLTSDYAGETQVTLVSGLFDQTGPAITADRLTNNATIRSLAVGLYSGILGGAGGAGLAFSGLRLDNAGLIAGATGGDAFAGLGGTGGAGVLLSDASFYNSGAVSGGAGGNAGNGGTGGAGVVLLGGATLVNNAWVTGGAGGGWPGAAGGSGGVGVKISGGAFTNRGIVSGGAGGLSGGAGGAGVLIDGGIFTNAGTVNGGHGGSGGQGGSAGVAVSFGAAAGRLIVDPGAVFNGDIVANSAVDDVLELSGAGGSATFGSAGLHFRNFTTFRDTGGAAWTITANVGDTSSMSTVSLSAVDTLLLNGGGFLTHDYSGLGVLDLQIGGSFSQSGPPIAAIHMVNEAQVVGFGGSSTTPQGSVGLDFVGASLDNKGGIVGGAAGYALNGGVGGVGVLLETGAAGFSNSGAVTGGSGGYSGYGHIQGAGGVGVYDHGAALTLGGTVAGGDGGGSFGQTGGSGGTGVVIAGGGTAVITGGVYGGAGGYNGGAGGVGLDIRANGSAANSGGAIVGGAGGGTVGGGGGAGVSLAGSYFLNQSLVQGGAGGGGAQGQRGGDGVDASAGVVRNVAAIAGGAGGSSLFYVAGFVGYGGTGVSLTGTASLVNSGRIAGGASGDMGYNPTGPIGGAAGGIGVSISGDATAFNSGVISGGAGGAAFAQLDTFGGAGGAAVYIDGGTFTNVGMLTGGVAGNGSAGAGAEGDAVKFGSHAGTLVVAPGAVFNGKVEANSAVDDVLELTGSTAATLTGFGTAFTGFTSVRIDAGSNWTLDPDVSVVNATTFSGDVGAATIVITGSGALGANLDGFGEIVANGGSLTVGAALTGVGSFVIENGATLDLVTNAAGGSGPIVFNGAGVLVVEQGGAFSRRIKGFGAGASVRHGQYVAGETLQYNIGAGLWEIDAAGVAVATFDIVGVSSGLTLNASGAIEGPTCFCRGTRILTARGEVAVEELCVGELIVTERGALEPVNWIGRQTISLRFSEPLRVLPIRIRAGALGDNVPSRDLLLSPGHALKVADVLVQAGALINGSSITRETDVPTVFVYYHVELDRHSLILAENTLAETFVDNVERLRFDNWAEFEALYPRGKTVTELPYPRAKSRRQVAPSIRAALERRAREIGAVTTAAA